METSSSVFGGALGSFGFIKSEQSWGVCATQKFAAVGRGTFRPQVTRSWGLGVEGFLFFAWQREPVLETED